MPIATLMNGFRLFEKKFSPSSIRLDHKTSPPLHCKETTNNLSESFNKLFSSRCPSVNNKDFHDHPLQGRFFNRPSPPFVQKGFEEPTKVPLRHSRAGGNSEFKGFADKGNYFIDN
jgi:hypothetical protein